VHSGVTTVYLEWREGGVNGLSLHFKKRGRGKAGKQGHWVYNFSYNLLIIGLIFIR